MVKAYFPELRAIYWSINWAFLYSKVLIRMCSQHVPRWRPLKVVDWILLLRLSDAGNVSGVSLCSSVLLRGELSVSLRSLRQQCKCCRPVSCESREQGSGPSGGPNTETSPRSSLARCPLSHTSPSSKVQPNRELSPSWRPNKRQDVPPDRVTFS